MKFKEIFEILTDFAPLRLSDELVALDGGFDNSGEILSTDREIDSVVFALDLTTECVQFAKSKNAQLIVTHHPAIYVPIKKISGAIKLASNLDVGIISLHLNLDAAERGIDFWFAKGIGAKKIEIVQKLSQGGYGRVFDINQKLGDIVNNIEKEFNTRVRVYGDTNKLIKKAVCFCGAGLDLKFSSMNVDLFVSCDVRHHVILDIIERGGCVVDITHYSCENYGLKKVCGLLAENSRLNKIKLNYFDDERFI